MVPLRCCIVILIIYTRKGDDYPLRVYSTGESSVSYLDYLEVYRVKQDNDS